MSLPNLVDLTVSTPVKDEPEVKPEQTSVVLETYVPRSLPLDVPSIQPQDLEKTGDDTPPVSSESCSVTLETETRSLDTTELDLTDPPTPVRSPPAKMRRCTRQSRRKL